MIATDSLHGTALDSHGAPLTAILPAEIEGVWHPFTDPSSDRTVRAHASPQSGLFEQQESGKFWVLRGSDGETKKFL